MGCQELKRTALRDILSVYQEDGTIKDVMDAIQSTKQFGNEWLKSYQAGGSIMKRASQLVLVFPVIVSSSLKMETAILVSKAIEKKCVSLLQLLFSATNLLDFQDARDLYDYIKKFHTNLDSKGSSITIDDFITAMDTITAAHKEMVIDPDTYNAVMEEMRDINTAAKEFFRESSLNDYVVGRNTFDGSVYVTLEAKGGNGGGGNNNQPPAEDKPKVFTYKTPDNFYPNQVFTTDINKANELVPTMMQVNFYSMKDGAVVNRTGVIGVKAKMYPVESSELIGRLSTKYSNGNTFFNIIRASTKEKSFFRDLAFAFEKTKMDAVNIAKGSVNARLFSTLERRADRNKSILLRKGDASPITTVVITQEEVEYLKKYSNMDIERMSTAKVILDGYNLMGIVICDDSIEVAKFLYDDGSGVYESVSYSALSKEDRNGDYKKIVNLMARMK